MVLLIVITPSMHNMWTTVPSLTTPSESEIAEVMRTTVTSPEACMARIAASQVRGSDPALGPDGAWNTRTAMQACSAN